MAVELNCECILLACNKEHRAMIEFVKPYERITLRQGFCVDYESSRAN